MQWLLSATWLQRLTKLDVSNNRLQHMHLQLLGQASLEALTCLILDSNHLYKRAVEAVAQGRWWQMLQSLSVRNTHLKDDGMQVLCETASPLLNTLDLSGNQVNVAGMTAFRDGTWPCLQSLTVDNCGLSERQTAWVLDICLRRADAPTLRVLSFNNNQMNLTAVLSLRAFSFPLQELHLSGAGFKGGLLWSLQDSLKVSILTESLEYLDISGVGNQEAAVFCFVGWSEHEAVMQDIYMFFLTNEGRTKFDSMSGGASEKFAQQSFENLFMRQGRNTRVKLLE